MRNNDMPLVTVVICTFRRPHLIPEAIRSAQHQTYSNLEIVVVDDASNDQTGQIVASIGDRRLRYILHDTNKGLPAGRNTGIRAAKGEYVAFLDDDDEWYPKKIERQVEFLLNSGFDAALTSLTLGDGCVWRFPRREITAGDLRQGNRFAPGSGLIVRTAVLRELWFDESIGQGEDWDMLIRLVRRRYRIGYLDEPLYRVNNGGHLRMTNEARNLCPKQLENRMRVLHKHREFFGEAWFRNHVAAMLLSHFFARRGKAGQLLYAVKRCGVSPVMFVFRRKLTQRLFPNPY